MLIQVPNSKLRVNQEYSLTYRANIFCRIACCKI